MGDQQDHHDDGDTEQQSEEQPTGSRTAPTTSRDVAAIGGVVPSTVVSASTGMSTIVTHDLTFLFETGITDPAEATGRLCVLELTTTWSQACCPSGSDRSQVANV
jgi:hypothetical protein